MGHEFKAGDKVVIEPGTGDDEFSDGVVYEVYDDGEGYLRVACDSNGYGFHANGGMFTFLPAPSQTKFKVGDKVRFTGGYDQVTSMKVGTVCEVDEVRGSTMEIQEPGRPYTWSWPDNGEGLELVTTPETPAEDPTKAAVLAWIKGNRDDYTDLEFNAIDAMLVDVFSLEVRVIPETIEFVPAT